MNCGRPAAGAFDGASCCPPRAPPGVRRDARRVVAGCRGIFVNSHGTVCAVAFSCDSRYRTRALAAVKSNRRPGPHIPVVDSPLHSASSSRQPDIRPTFSSLRQPHTLCSWCMQSVHLRPLCKCSVQTRQALTFCAGIDWLQVTSSRSTNHCSYNTPTGRLRHSLVQTSTARPLQFSDPIPR